MIKMEDFQKSVYEERKELKDRIDKLIFFINGDMFKIIKLDEQVRLRMQYTYMMLYRNILDERIEHFVKCHTFIKI